MLNYLMVLNLRIRIRIFLVSSKRKQCPSRLLSFAWCARYKWLHIGSHSLRTPSTLLLSFRRQDRTSAWPVSTSRQSHDRWLGCWLNLLICCGLAGQNYWLKKRTIKVEIKVCSIRKMLRNRPIVSRTLRY